MNRSKQELESSLEDSLSFGVVALAVMADVPFPVL